MHVFLPAPASSIFAPQPLFFSFLFFSFLFFSFLHDVMRAYRIGACSSAQLSSCKVPTYLPQLEGLLTKPVRVNQLDLHTNSFPFNTMKSDFTVG
ncbi:hypothetical protein BGZ57DRAFT_144324 [Hyaloscypha finlandica]|nr:hypothetical protein BGZ57DRAFT_144324 [Hyaloscypha finlandica]